MSFFVQMERKMVIIWFKFRHMIVGLYLIVYIKELT